MVRSSFGPALTDRDSVHQLALQLSGKAISITTTHAAVVEHQPQFCKPYGDGIRSWSLSPVGIIYPYQAVLDGGDVICLRVNYLQWRSKNNPPRSIFTTLIVNKLLTGRCADIFVIWRPCGELRFSQKSQSLRLTPTVESCQLSQAR